MHSVQLARQGFVLCSLAGVSIVTQSLDGTFPLRAENFSLIIENYFLRQVSFPPVLQIKNISCYNAVFHFEEYYFYREASIHSEALKYVFLYSDACDFSQQAAFSGEGSFMKNFFFFF